MWNDPRKSGMWSLLLSKKGLNIYICTYILVRTINKIFSNISVPGNPSNRSVSEKQILTDSHTYPTCIKNFIKIDSVASEEFGHKHYDSRILLD